MYNDIYMLSFISAMRMYKSFKKMQPFNWKGAFKNLQI